MNTLDNVNLGLANFWKVTCLDKDGNINDANNPNGSLDNIAGITNKGKNIFGMMPHPERAADSNL